MVFQECMFRVADNSGFKTLKLIKVLKGSYRRTANIGDSIVTAVQTKRRSSGLGQERVVRALVVNSRKGLNRPDGSSIRFDKNSCVLLGEDLKPRASRVLHPLPRELRNTVFSKLLFLSDVIL